MCSDHFGDNSEPKSGSPHSRVVYPGSNTESPSPSGDTGPIVEHVEPRFVRQRPNGNRHVWAAVVQCVPKQVFEESFQPCGVRFERQVIIDP